MPYLGFNKMKIHIWSGFQTPSSHIIWNLTFGFHKGHHLMWYPKGFKLRIGLKTYLILTFFLHPPNIGKDPPLPNVWSHFFQEHKEIHLFSLQRIGPRGKILCRWYWDSHLLFPTYAFFFHLIFFLHTCLFFSFFLLLPNFQCQLASFDSIFIHVFGRFLGPCFLKCPKISLVHRQVFFPILEVK